MKKAREILFQNINRHGPGIVVLGFSLIVPSEIYAVGFDIDRAVTGMLDPLIKGIDAHYGKAIFASGSVSAFALGQGDLATRFRGFGIGAGVAALSMMGIKLGLGI